MRFLDLLRKAKPVTQSFLVEHAYVGLQKRNAYALEGYAQNPIVYSCISLIARAAASVELEIHKGDQVLAEHPLYDLLSKPNPTQSWKGFIQELITFHRTYGEFFLLKLPRNGAPKELYLLDPRYVEVKTPKSGSLPAAYVYGNSENKTTYPINPLTGASQVLHMKTVNPLDPWRGLSPLSAAARAADVHNSGAKWNAKLLQNSARPSGIIEVQGPADTNLIDTLRTYFKKAWQGEDNVGEVPVLSGGAKFTQMSMNAKDMEFTSGMTEAAKNIALVYGVPLPLVTTEAATFSNMDAALERLWSDTVLPLLDEVMEGLSRFLGKDFDGVKLHYNADSIPALEGRRTRLYERMQKAVAGTLLSPDEAREEMGFDPKGADMLLVSGSMKPIDKLGEEQALDQALEKVGITGDLKKKLLEAEFGG